MELAEAPETGPLQRFRQAIQRVQGPGHLKPFGTAGYVRAPSGFWAILVTCLFLTYANNGQAVPQSLLQETGIVL